LFFGNFQAFPCTLRAQQGQLCWPARKRRTARLFQFVVAAFTALKEGFLLLFWLKREEPSSVSLSSFRLSGSGERRSCFSLCLPSWKQQEQAEAGVLSTASGQAVSSIALKFV